MTKTTISAIIDRLGVTRYTWTIWILVGLALVFDGYDYIIVAYTMPQMAQEWGLTKVQTGSLASWSMLGVVIGGVIAGMCSDRFGRKKTLAFFVAFYSLLTFPIYFAPSFAVFAMLRIISGIGIGACIPVAITLASENFPTKNRGFFTAATLCFYGWGWVLGGIVALNVVPAYGWRVCFLIGGLPALYAVFILYKMPESMAWLIGKGREAEAIEIIKRMEKVATGKAGEWLPGSIVLPPPAKRVGVSALFSSGYVKATIGVWLLYFMSMFIIYGVTSWMPTLLVERGYGLVLGYSFSILQNLVGSIGGFATGFVADIIGRRKNVIISFLFTAAAILLLGSVTGKWPVLIIAVLVGVCMQYANGGALPLMTEIYPTEFRNTGVSWAQSFGRIAGFLSPLVVGYVQQVGLDFSNTMKMFAFPAIICVLVSVFLIVETKGRTVDSVVGIKA
ncbi:transporter, major facilitator family protein [Desulfitobacterium hafniense DP7]|uniref:Transporter, major facilitator family protein n=1 Tax=Desulfitobacterium hafniense DP7 TaxID=537010 RepID=G9XU23_DESHA|nr:MFS transporter [Desulfitobacterium hafniense]EHL04806.1 transporter, major facilitator family protein [Desulfitobacterium hafniense DP7]